MSDTEYCYPPDFTVLKNKAGLRDAEQLEQFERLKTINRLRHCPLDIPTTYEGYKEIHRRIFQDVYEWAGQPRSVDIRKADYFCRASYIDQEMQRQFRVLQRENNLKDLQAPEFAVRAAEHLGEINAIHPFREGNGRTQRVFLRNLAHQAGHAIDLTRIERDAWLHASISSFRDQDHKPTENVVRNAMVEWERTLKEARKERLEGTAATRIQAANRDRDRER